MLAALGAAVKAFRGASGETPHGFAAVAEATGIGVDATLSVDASGGAFPFWQAQSDGLDVGCCVFRSQWTMYPERARRPLSPPPTWGCAATGDSGAPTLVELTPDSQVALRPSRAR